MEQRDALAEARAEAADGLRRERDLRHEHDRTQPALERGRARLEVDLSLAAPGRAVEQHVAAGAGVQRADDPRDRLLLQPGELSGLSLAYEPFADAGLSALAARLALQRRDQRQRAGRRRAVVVGDPERELDERLRQLLDDALDRRHVDACGRLDAELDHEPAPFRVAEPDLDDGADARVLRHLVRERARDGARGYEGIHRRQVRHKARLLGCAPGVPGTPLAVRGRRGQYE